MYYIMVRLVRLELTRLSARVSKTRMATNYITTACLVGIAGFEPATTCTPCKYATGLRYIPLVPLLRFELRELLLLREMTLPICPQGHSIWSPPLDSNEHPPGPKPGDLPISPKGVSGANSRDRTRFNGSSDRRNDHIC